MAKGSTSKTVVWVLMALLVFGLGGFGITNFSGSLRAIGSVGDHEITVSRYVDAVRQEIDALQAQTGQPLPANTAIQLGLDKRALAKLIAFTALDDEAARLGVSVGDGNLREQLLQVPAFQGLDGKFDREAYKFYLSRKGQTEAQFETELRDDLSRGILQQAVLTGLREGQAYADTLTRFLAERRDFEWAALTEADLDQPLADPTEEQLAAFHKDHAAIFTLPERKRITYAWLTPEMIADSVEVDDSELKKLYEDRSDEFNTPEHRLVERLAFPDEAAAEQAKIAIENGAKSFDDLVAERGLELSDVDMGDVAQSDLGAAGAAVFTAESGDVVGPFDTDLGPALFRINGVLAAHTMSFDEARPTLRDELAIDRARRQIDDERDKIDDMLAGGATLEEVVRETDMELATIAWTKDSSDGAAAYSAFQDEAAKVSEGDYPSVIGLDDGGIAAMRLDAVLAPELQPLDQIRDAVTETWRQDTLSRTLEAQATALLPKIDAETDLASLGLTVTAEQDVLRSSFIDGTPPGFLDAVFHMKPGEARVLPMPGGAVLVRLDALNPPDENDSDVAALHRQLSQQAANGQAQDLFQYYINDVQSRVGLRLDQQAINAVNANF